MITKLERLVPICQNELIFEPKDCSQCGCDMIECLECLKEIYDKLYGGTKCSQ